MRRSAALAALLSAAVPAGAFDYGSDKWKQSGSQKDNVLGPGSNTWTPASSPPSAPSAPKPPKETPSQRRAKDLRRRAIDANKPGNRKEAIRLAKESLDEHYDSNMADWLAWLEGADFWEDADLASRRNDWSSAADLYRKALARARGRWDADDAERLQAKLEFAEEHVAYEAERAPANEKARKNRLEAERINEEAGKLLAAGKDRDAAAKAREALALVGGEKRILLILHTAEARVAAFEGRLDSSIHWFRKVLEVDPENEPAKTALARLTEVRDAQAKALAPELPKAKENIEVASWPHQDAMVVDARVSAAAAPPPAAAAPQSEEVRRAFEAIGRRDTAEALDWCEKALAKDPGNAELVRMADLLRYTAERKKTLGASELSDAEKEKRLLDQWGKDYLEIVTKLAKAPREPLPQVTSKATPNAFSRWMRDSIADDLVADAGSFLLAGAKKEALENVEAALTVAPWRPELHAMRRRLLSPEERAKPAPPENAPFPFEARR